MISKNLKFGEFTEVDGCNWAKIFLKWRHDQFYHKLSYFKWHYVSLLRFWIQRKILGIFCVQVSKPQSKRF